MTKKLITISVILAFAMTLGLVGAVNAAGVSYDDDTVVNITGATGSELKIKSGSQADSVAVDTASVTIGLATGSDITFESASGKIMSVSGCTSTYATFTAGTPSTMQIVYNATGCTSAVLTIGEGTLTEVNVAASPLTAATASAYTVTFRTVNPLIAGQKIKLVFGDGFTIAESGAEAMVTTFTDDGDAIGTLGATGLVSTAADKTIIITIPDDTTVAASSVINIVLDGTEVTKTLITNPTTASAATAVSGVDIYTTTSTGTTIDKKENQTAFNRVIDLEPGWNIFAPSQALETPAYATVILPITSSVSTIYTLTRGAGTMVWETPTTIDPLYGYAIYITGGSTVKLPLDFAKEAPGNFAFSRELEHKGWFLIGYTGNAASADAYGLRLDGLVGTGVNGNDAYDSIVDLTGAGTDTAQSSHAWAANPTEHLNAATTLEFTKDYCAAVSVNTTGMTLTGNREEG